MKRSQFLVVVIMIILITSIVGISVSYSAAPPAEDADPLVSGRPTFVPIQTIGPFPSLVSIFVNIPDPNLNLALHQKLGKPISEGIFYTELAGITGALNLNGKNISNAEGVQYCTNISKLYMNDNNLSYLPPMNIMVGLEMVSFRNNNFVEIPCQLCAVPNLVGIDISYNPITTLGASIATASSLKSLYLESCALTSFPSELTSMSGLQTLWLDHNDIGSIPSAIGNMTALINLYMVDTGLSSLPSELYTLSNIQVLQLSENNVSSLSSAISGMTDLQYLTVYNNKLESIPNEICSISSLISILADGNRLYSLPAGIGGTNIQQISVLNNRIEQLPSGIGNAPSLDYLDVRVNRLKELPSSLDNIFYGYLSLEFNFLDVSPGSDARSIIDNTSGFVLYERQLKPIEEVTAVPSAESILLSWDAGQNGSSGGATWTVDSYNVFLIESGNTYTKLEELLPTQLSFEHSGLTPQTTYLYRVGVDYHVVVPANSIDAIIRAYTEVEPTTLALNQATPSPSPSAQAQSEQPAEDPETMDDEAAASQADNQVLEINTESESKTSLPIWAIVVIAVLGAGVIGTGVTLGIMKAKGGKASSKK